MRKRLVAVVGSRTKNKDDSDRCRMLVNSALCCLHKDKNIILSGGAGSGADYWAKVLSMHRGFDYIEVPANWTYKGKSAGHIRNETIAELCDIAVVIWDGKSRGSRNVIGWLQKFNKPYWVIQL